MMWFGLARFLFDGMCQPMVSCAYSISDVLDYGQCDLKITKIRAIAFINIKKMCTYVYDFKQMFLLSLNECDFVNFCQYAVNFVFDLQIREQKTDNNPLEKIERVQC